MKNFSKLYDIMSDEEKRKLFSYVIKQQKYKIKSENRIQEQEFECKISIIPMHSYLDDCIVIKKLEQMIIVKKTS